MPLETVNLDDIYLTNSECTSKLLAKATAFFHFADTSFSDHEFLLASLSSRQVWAYRGIACRLDLLIFVNEKRVPSGASPMIRNLAHSLQNAEIWSSLSLSISLLVLQEDKNGTDCPNISIFIRHGKTKPTQPSAEEFYENTNFNPPEGVSCASFERLEIELRLTSKSLKQKNNRPSHYNNENEKEELRLFDQTIESGNVVEICKSQEVIEKKKDNLNPTMKCSDESAHRNNSLSTHVQACSMCCNKSCPDELQLMQGANEKDFQLIQNNYLYFKQWKKSHQNEIYSKLTQENDVIWSNYQEMAQVNETLHKVQKIEEKLITDEDEMLLSQISLHTSASNTQSLESNDFYLWDICEPTPQINLSPSSFERLSQDCDKVDLEYREEFQVNACLMFQTALYLFLIGNNGWAKKGFCNYKLEGPYPEKCLATCVPVLFSLNFLQSMEYNAQYILTITHIFSGVLFENAQSPGLRKKLICISGTNSRNNTNDFPQEVIGDNANKFKIMLQSSLWQMMQKKLYSSTANKRLWKEISSKISIIDKDKRNSIFFPQENDVETERNDWTKFEMEDNDFDDLLKQPHGSKPFNDRKRQRMEESENEEMLLVNEYEDSSKSYDEALFFYDFSSEDIMLI